MFLMSYIHKVFPQCEFSDAASGSLLGKRLPHISTHMVSPQHEYLQTGGDRKQAWGLSTFTMSTGGFPQCDSSRAELAKSCHKRLSEFF